MAVAKSPAVYSSARARTLPVRPGGLRARRAEPAASRSKGPTPLMEPSGLAKFRGEVWGRGRQPPPERAGQAPLPARSSVLLRLPRPRCGQAAPGSAGAWGVEGAGPPPQPPAPQCARCSLRSNFSGNAKSTARPPQSPGRVRRQPGRESRSRSRRGGSAKQAAAGLHSEDEPLSGACEASQQQSNPSPRISRSPLPARFPRSRGFPGAAAAASPGLRGPAPRSQPRPALGSVTKPRARGAPPGSAARAEDAPCAGPRALQDI
nr:serine/arginine-rich splicing factor 12-like [Chelonoidis abingdonii]